MVELLKKGSKSGLEISEIHDPPGGLRRLTRDSNAYVERVAVESGAFVAFRHVGQPMRRFKMKVFVDVHRLKSFPGKRAQYKPVVPPVAGHWVGVYGRFGRSRQVS